MQLHGLLPRRFFTPWPSVPLQGVSIDKDQLEQAKETFYSMVGWDTIDGSRRQGKLGELGIEWVSGYMGGAVED